MNRNNFLLLAALLGLAFFVHSSMTQQEKGTVKTFLNDKKTQGGIMSADSIIYFLDKHLYSQDENGNFHKVINFLFTYIERGVYFDERGKPFIGTEVSGINSANGTVPDFFIEVIKDKLKSGDTVIFNNVTAMLDFKDQNTIYNSPKITLVVK